MLTCGIIFIILRTLRILFTQAGQDKMTYYTNSGVFTYLLLMSCKFIKQAYHLCMYVAVAIIYTTVMSMLSPWKRLFDTSLFNSAIDYLDK